MSNTTNNTKITLVLLWITTMFFMVFADIFSIIVELEVGNTFDIPMDVKTAMAIAAVVTAFPILMIILSWVLPFKKSRLANIIIGVFTIVYIVGGASPTLHYIIIASIEILLLIAIIYISVKWKQQDHIN